MKSPAKYGVAAGLHCPNGEDARARIEEGWQFIAVASELRLMLNGANQVLQALKPGASKGEMAKY